ncbi:MAG: hypothetical protein HY371_02630, partial [Devosia nanyangense]|nr:hypothetical protein [Devosia nanyangense]
VRVHVKDLSVIGRNTQGDRLVRKEESDKLASVAPVVVEEEDEEGGGAMVEDEYGGSGDELYDKAVNIVLQDKKASTSYIQRRLAIGYNKAATLIERMEREGVISQANHAGKREILAGGGGESY